MERNKEPSVAECMCVLGRGRRNEAREKQGARQHGAGRELKGCWLCLMIIKIISTLFLQ